MEISPETVAQGAEECYILTVNRIRARRPARGAALFFLEGGMHLQGGTHVSRRRVRIFRRGTRAPPYGTVC